MNIARQHRLPLRAACFALLLALLPPPLLAADANANPPGGMAFQGFLTDRDGKARGQDSPANHTIYFTLYNSPNSTEAGAKLWSESQVVTVDKGHFSVVLGEGTPIPGSSTTDLSSYFIGDTSAGRYLGIQVGTEDEISPRIQFLSVPYAHLARYATELVGSSSASALTVANGITTKTLSATDSITAATSITAANFVGAGTIPIGGIIMWSGSINDIPSGWALCDGKTVAGYVTPNLAIRFVIGSGEHAVDSVGGSDKAALTTENMPAHSHTYTLDMRPIGSYQNNGLKLFDIDTVHGETITKSSMTTSSVGSGKSFSILPPYYSLAFIMRIQ